MNPPQYPFTGGSLSTADPDVPLPDPTEPRPDHEPLPAPWAEEPAGPPVDAPAMASAVAAGPGELPPELPPGTRVGEYVLESRVGIGGMAEVYAAVHPVIGRRAAVKVLHASMGSIPMVRERFIREARAVNQIRHPNICDIFSFGTLDDGRSYFVMEWLDGQTLGAQLLRDRLLLGDVLTVLDGVAAALQAAHRAGIVHRDVKPENVFLTLTPDGEPRVKLLDFGIAKLLGPGDSLASGEAVQAAGTLTADGAGEAPADAGLTVASSVVGTPEYLSPEQALGIPVDQRSDVYSLGVMAYEMATGRLPFHSSNTSDLINKHVVERPPDPLEVAPELPPAIAELLRRMLAKPPESRPELDEVRAVLGAAMRAEQGLPGAGEPVAPATDEAPRVELLERLGRLEARREAEARTSGTTALAAPEAAAVVAAAPVLAAEEAMAGAAAEAAAGAPAGAAASPVEAARSAVETVAPAAPEVVPQPAPIPPGVSRPSSDLAPGPAHGPRWTRLLLIAAPVVVILAGAAGLLVLRGGSTPPPAAPAGATTTTPPAASGPDPTAATSGVVVSRPARLVLQVNVPAARVTLDGRVVDARISDGRIEIPVDLPGHHTLQVSAPGRRTHRQALTLTSGQTATLEINLAPAAGKRQRAGRRNRQLDDLMDQALETPRR
jgi:serine/threonine-protein kinase